MSQIKNIKLGIKAMLDQMQRDGDLGEVQVDDYRADVLTRDIGAYPCVVLSAPTLESEFETNQENTRTYTFILLCIEKNENIDSSTRVEELIESLADVFDTDFTIGGLALAGVLPATSTPQVVEINGKSHILFTVTLKVRALSNVL